MENGIPSGYSGVKWQEADTLALSLAKHFAKANNKRSSRWITDLKYDESDMGEARRNRVES